MTEFLSALKADFLDRRLLPFIALVVVALAAAVAYVALGGSSGSSSPSASTPVQSDTGASKLTISQITPETATAEVPTGEATQHAGVARNPFKPVVAIKTPTSSSASTAVSTSGASSSSSSSSSSSGGTSTSTTPATTTPAKPKPKIVYHVAAMFGLVPAGGATPGTELTPFVNIPLLTPLPSSQLPLIVFRGVTTGGKSATFTVVGEVILHGSATCLPSPEQCEAIDVAPGKTELMEFIPSSGPTQVYELRVVSIAAEKASKASLHSLMDSESKVGRELLRSSGHLSIPFLHYTSQGVLAFASRRPYGRAARSASRR